MRKILMMVVTALVLMGTSVTTKAASLLKVSNVGISQNNDNGLVLRHSSQILGNSDMRMAQHGSHGSHGSHASHASHSSHFSGR